jgi:hypothetical protein
MNAFGQSTFSVTLYLLILTLSLESSCRACLPINKWCSLQTRASLFGYEVSGFSVKSSVQNLLRYISFECVLAINIGGNWRLITELGFKYLWGLCVIWPNARPCYVNFCCCYGPWFSYLSQKHYNLESTRTTPLRWTGLSTREAHILFKHMSCMI